MAQFSVILMAFSGLVLHVTWVHGQTGSCGMMEFTPDPPEKAHVQNDTHVDEEIYRSDQASFYGCVELCKVTNGCTCLNYETNVTTCVLYSTSGTPTFETNAGDWLFVKIADTAFPTSPATCDPSGCLTKQYCRTIQGSPACLNFPS